jgi:hypothetical protein
MELAGRHLLFGVAVAIAIGAGVAWTQRAPQPAREAEVAGDAPSSASTRSAAPALYKWQDDQGVWNYTDQPPADRPFERITGTPNVNSVPTVVPDIGQAEASTPPTP